MPYRQVASARIRQALPATSTSGLRLLGGELRWALRDERVRLARPRLAPALNADDDLAALAEGVGKRARVRHGDGGAAGPVANPEVRDGPVARVAGLDLARELVDLARRGAAQELARRSRLAGSGEARVDQRAGQQHGDAERH